MRGITRIVPLLAVTVLLLPAVAGAVPADTTGADMGVTATVTPAKLFVGQPATFVLTATNAGPSRANIVRLTATPNGKVTIASMTPSRPDENCSTKGRTVTCTVAFLDPGQSFQLTLVITTQAPDTLSVTAGVLAVEPDPNTANQQATAETTVLAPDSVPPTNLSVGSLDQFEPPKFTVSWRGKDDGSGLDSYSVRYRSAPPTGVFGPYVTWQHGTLKTAEFTAEPGRTYCFSVTATDVAGNTAPYSAESCTAVPEPATVFKRTGSWRLVTNLASVTGHYLASSQANASLTLHGVQAKNIALYVTKCPTCGSIDITWRGHSLGTLDLHAKSVKHASLAIVTSEGLQTGDLVVKVTPPAPAKVAPPKPVKPVKHHSHSTPTAPPTPTTPTPPPAPKPVEIEAIGISRV